MYLSNFQEHEKRAHEQVAILQESSTIIISNLPGNHKDTDLIKKVAPKSEC